MWLLVAIGCMPLQFDVEGNTAVMTGDLRSNAKQRLENLFDEYPDLEWIELLDCPGSLDDDAVAEAGRFVRAQEVNTRVPADGEIYSGAVDFFIAGVEREYQNGGVVGVHSWSDGRVEGADLPEDAPVHDLYLDYYEDMGVSTDFYWFTLNAADYDGMHEMTREEMIFYGLLIE